MSNKSAIFLSALMAFQSGTALAQVDGDVTDQTNDSAGYITTRECIAEAIKDLQGDNTSINISDNFIMGISFESPLNATSNHLVTSFRIETFSDDTHVRVKSLTHSFYNAITERPEAGVLEPATQREVSIAYETGAYPMGIFEDLESYTNSVVFEQIANGTLVHSGYGQTDYDAVRAATYVDQNAKACFPTLVG